MADTPISATYASASSFTVASDKAAEFVVGVRVQANCGVDGIKHGTVTSNGTATVTVTLDSGSLTSNLTGVLHGNDVPASLCNHGHTSKADGGDLPDYVKADCSVPFTEGHIAGTGAYTGFKFTETGVAANSGKWIYQVDNSQASLLAVNDAETVFNAVWTVDRSGATPTYFTVTPTLIASGGIDTDTLNGQDVSDGVIPQAIGTAKGDLIGFSASATPVRLGVGGDGSVLGVVNGFPGYVSNPAPPGVVYPFAGTALPSGFLWAEGSAVSRTTYAALFAAIGTTWGVGDGSTTFNLPDMRGRATIGAGSGSGLTPRALAAKGGAETHTLTTNEIPAHTHLIPSISGAGTAKYGPTSLSNPTNNQIATEPNITTGSSHNNMQPWVSLNHIIKF